MHIIIPRKRVLYSNGLEGPKGPDFKPPPRIERVSRRHGTPHISTTREISDESRWARSPKMERDSGVNPGDAHTEYNECKY